MLGQVDLPIRARGLGGTGNGFGRGVEQIDGGEAGADYAPAGETRRQRQGIEPLAGDAQEREPRGVVNPNDLRLQRVAVDRLQIDLAASLMAAAEVTTRSELTGNAAAYVVKRTGLRWAVDRTT